MSFVVKRNESLGSSVQVQLPASKSISNRALIINALSRSDKTIRNLAKCDDTDVLLKALSSKESSFDIGAAGTAMRFLTAYLSMHEGVWSITGSERMKQRPIQVLVEVLRELGANVEYIEKEGYPPLRVEGTLMQGGEIEIEGNVSSQYISALLMIAPMMQEGLTLRLRGEIISKPYIEMTLRMMKDFGVSSEWLSDAVIRVPHKAYLPVEYVVENDWSAASYWYEIVALSAPGLICFLPHLYQESLQGDSKVKEIYKSLGVQTTFVEENGQKGIKIQKSDVAPSHYEYDFSGQPDLAQTVVVTCCCLGTTFHFTGLQTLKIKETDRIAALINECEKLGFILEEEEEGSLSWEGKRTEKAKLPKIATYNDHRMAMAFAPACLVLDALEIEHPEVVSKSYPDYWKAVEEVVSSVKSSD